MTVARYVNGKPVEESEISGFVVSNAAIDRAFASAENRARKSDPSSNEKTRSTDNGTVG